MKNKGLKRLITGLAIGLLGVLILFPYSCAPKRVQVVYDKEGNSRYSEIDPKHKKKGPPAHAPAHGYRAKHQYRYYPAHKVYYDTGRRLYFYLKGDNWEVGASLPSHIRIGLGKSVSIELHTDKPYLHHAEHVKKYPPGQLKKKNKKKNKWG
ncbi:MAG: hypothetical protein JRF72_16370 [Deltaproteobacteria bacterium]|jgi:hypothetical protein|nr:hypothetical protein [Deltaproteobacteria bacterium]